MTASSSTSGRQTPASFPCWRATSAPSTSPPRFWPKSTGLDHASALEAGLHVVEPDLEVPAEAATSRRGLSFQDHQCLILARTHGWVCVTNDGRLRKVCAEDGVDVLWGLEMLALLVEAGGLPGDDAVEFAHQMARLNHFLTPDILARFDGRVRGFS